MSAGANHLRLRRALEGLIGVPATEGNRIDVLRNGDQIFPAMLGAIEHATETVDFLTFIYWTGETGRSFAQALAARARAGVRVRVLLDAVGARSVDTELVSMMSDAGCQVEWFRPVTKLKPGEWNHRTHRKVLICDEDIAFTGGVGIADEWRGDARGPDEWRDTHFRVQGPAVDGLRAAFVDNWAETGRVLFDERDRFPEQPQCGTTIVQVVRGAAETGWSDISTMVRALIGLAQGCIRITTAYFAPDDVTLGLLCEAAHRGVQVQLLLNGPNGDKRFEQVASKASYAQMLECGIEIHEFQPTMLHAKVMTVDDVVAAVGSANFNSRSLSLDEEVDLVVIDPDVVRLLDDHFDDDLTRAERIDAETWAERGLLEKVAEKATQLSPVRTQL